MLSSGNTRSDVDTYLRVNRNLDVLISKTRPGIQESLEKQLVRDFISALLLNDTERGGPYPDGGRQGGQETRR